MVLMTLKYLKMECSAGEICGGAVNVENCVLFFTLLGAWTEILSSTLFEARPQEFHIFQTLMDFLEDSHAEENMIKKNQVRSSEVKNLSNCVFFISGTLTIRRDWDPKYNETYMDNGITIDEVDTWNECGVPQLCVVNATREKCTPDHPLYNATFDGCPPVYPVQPCIPAWGGTEIHSYIHTSQISTTLVFTLNVKVLTYFYFSIMFYVLCCFQHGKNGVNVTRADQMVRTVAARESEQENAGTAAGKRALAISQWRNARMNVEKIVVLIMLAKTNAT